MTAELDGVRPGESSRCGALLKMKEVAIKAGKKLLRFRNVSLRNKLSMF